MSDTRIASEKVVLAAPLSFAGSAGRIWPLRLKSDDTWKRAALIVLALVLIALAWTVVLSWYIIFGLLLVPYRIVRRGQRKRKMQGFQHRETLSAIQAPTAAVTVAPPAPATGQLMAGEADRQLPAAPAS
jgi:uncharacterized membrane-anchored protein